MPASHACMYVWRQTYCMRVYAYKIEFITIMNTYAFMCNLPSDDRAWSLWITVYAHSFPQITQISSCNLQSAMADGR